MMLPGYGSATKISPLGAVIISRGSSRSVAYCWTLKPAGAFGQASPGRPTTLGLLSADSVAYGGGRAFNVILRLGSGDLKRKGVNGGVGAGPPDSGPGGAFGSTFADGAGALPFLFPSDLM